MMLSQKTRAARLFAAYATLAWIAGTDRVLAQTTIIVDQAGSGDYTLIAPALAAAADGDTIHVLAGVYQGQILLNKSVTLGCEGPDLVTLRNDLGDTVVVERQRTVTISGCAITGAGHGIALKQDSSAVITNNVIVGNTDGVRVIECDAGSISVRNNVLAFNRSDGLETFCRDSLLTVNNIITGNGECGIRFGVTNSSHNNVDLNTTNYCSSPPPGPGDIPAVVPVPAGFVSPGFVSPNTGDYRLLSNAVGRNRGNPVPADNDPDGTRNDCGAYGGPGSAGFFPSPEGGPTIRSMSLFPSSVPKGGTVRLQATGRVNVQ